MWWSRLNSEGKVSLHTGQDIFCKGLPPSLSSGSDWFWSCAARFLLVLTMRLALKVSVRLGPPLLFLLSSEAVGFFLFLPPLDLTGVPSSPVSWPRLDWASRLPWVRLWRCMFPLVVKVWPHKSQLNGLSPECTSMCRSRDEKDESIFPHRQQ